MFAAKGMCMYCITRYQDNYYNTLQFVIGDVLRKSVWEQLRMMVTAGSPEYESFSLHL